MSIVLVIGVLLFIIVAMIVVFDLLTVREPKMLFQESVVLCIVLSIIVYLIKVYQTL